jgi:hypothetical protein
MACRAIRSVLRWRPFEGTAGSRSVRHSVYNCMSEKLLNVCCAVACELRFRRRVSPVVMVNSNLSHADAPMSLTAEFGGKTDGFVPGESLARGVILKAGITFRGRCVRPTTTPQRN